MSDELEKTLLVHLGALAQQESWRIYELPKAIAERAVPILRLLDARGWIELHRYKLVNGERKATIGWMSHVSDKPNFFEDWERIIAKYAGELTREQRDEAPELRVSPRGKAKLAELDLVPAGRNEDTPNGTTPKKPGGRKQSRKRAKRTEPAKNDRKALEQGGVTINTINTERLVMGDEFHGIKGSTIVNRSESTDSFNRTAPEDSRKGAVAGASGRMRRILSWLIDHIVAALIVGVLLAALLAWLRLG